MAHHHATGLTRRAVLAATVTAAGAGLVASGGLVERRSRAAPAGPAPAPVPSPPRPSPVPAPTPSDVDCPRLAEAVQRRVTAFLAGRDAHASIAVLDRASGVGLTVDGTEPFRTASIVKVDILVALMLRHQRRGTALSEDETASARAMITASDNAAASALWWRAGGGAGLASANRALGLDRTTPGTGGAWGSTTTTALDQLRLLTAIADERGPLSDANRRYLLALMAEVIGSQRWGVPAAADGATAVHVKNGWFPLSSHRGRWVVNSVGRVVEPDHDWLAVVLSDRHATHAAGIALVEATAKLAVSGLRAVTCPPVRHDGAPSEPRRGW